MGMLPSCLPNIPLDPIEACCCQPAPEELLTVGSASDRNSELVKVPRISRDGDELLLKQQHLYHLLHLREYHRRWSRKKMEE